MFKGIQYKGVSVATLSFIACVFGGTAHAEEYNVNPGMWETTFKMELTGMPPEMAAMMQRLIGEVEQRLIQLAALIKDCDALLVSGVGNNPRKKTLQVY